MRYVALLLFLLMGISISTLAQNNHSISGYILDAATGEELIGATVFVEEIKDGTASNVYGFYSLTLPFRVGN